MNVYLLVTIAMAWEAGQPPRPALVVITIYNYLLRNHLTRPRRKDVTEWNVNNSGKVRVAIMSRTNV